MESLPFIWIISRGFIGGVYCIFVLDKILEWGAAIFYCACCSLEGFLCF